jgi:serine/threonine protein kinase
MPPEPGRPAASGAPHYRRVGKYEVQAHIATGGMGAVYRAKDVELGRDVALKILPPELAAKPAVLARFRQEAKHAARLRHENVVTLYEFGADEERGVYYLAMELVVGLDLHEYITRKGRLKPDRARRILLQAARALDHAHQQGLIHRDIKPSNFLITRHHGRLLVKMTDLGLALEAGDDEFRVTREGSTVGSIDYMAPEQARDSRAVDIRSDIYALGCTFYHMLAGQAPFAEGSLAERVLKHQEAEPPDVREFNPAVSDDLVRILNRMLAKVPADRYQSPADLIEDLEGARSQPPGADEVAPAGPEPEAAPTRAPGTDSAMDVTPGAPTPHEGVPDGRRHHKRPASSPAELPTVSPERRRAAAGQFEHAVEAVALANHDYAIQLLLSCCKLDPFTLKYRKVLRRAEKAKFAGGAPRGVLAWMGTQLKRAKLRAAQRSGDHLAVLARGEDLLARNPRDGSAQLQMAEAADSLGLLDLAIWLLEEARAGGRKDPRTDRRLAHLLEKRGDLPEAIALWEQVKKADPTDVEAAQKVLDLAASDTIRRGKYLEETQTRP